jgi:hypothetical protein
MILIVDIDKLLDSTTDLKMDIDDFPILTIEIDKILERTSEW